MKYVIISPNISGILHSINDGHSVQHFRLKSHFFYQIFYARGLYIIFQLHFQFHFLLIQSSLAVTWSKPSPTPSSKPQTRLPFSGSSPCLICTHSCFLLLGLHFHPLATSTHPLNPILSLFDPNTSRLPQRAPSPSKAYQMEAIVHKPIVIFCLKPVTLLYEMYIFPVSKTMPMTLPYLRSLQCPRVCLTEPFYPHCAIFF